MRAIARAGLLVLWVSAAGCLPDLESECASVGDCPEVTPLCIGGICTRVGSGDGGRADVTPPNDGAPDRAVGDGGRGDVAVGDDGGVCMEGATEVCDGVDNDCDENVDEGADGMALSRSCYTGEPATQNRGLCRPGQAQCMGGEYGPCEGEVVPVEEVCGDQDRVCPLCNGEDDDCDGAEDEGLVRVCGPEMIGVCQPGSEQCGAGGWLGCQGTVSPGVEICDGLNNDCDFAVDEGLDECQCAAGETQGCYSGPEGTEGVGICRGGNQECTDGGTFGPCEGEVRPGIEACNLVDDDCDGRPDEDTGGAMCSVGVGACRQVGVLRCPPDSMELRCDAEAGEDQPEQCNTIDDDCDGRTDEGLAGMACDVGRGECEAQGRIVCVADGPPRCEGVPGEPEPETCNNRDDDCDGLTDEGDGEGEGRPMVRGCYPGPGGTEGIGICQAGTQVCNNGAYGACVGATLPLPERCNGIDDNCDLVRDNLAVGRCGCLLGETRACYTAPDNTAGVGRCRRGEAACVEAADSSTSYGACVGEVLPAAETCNGIDDDCNGVIDSGGADALCADPFGGVSVCVAAACDFNCQATWVNRNANPVDGCERGCGSRPDHVAILGHPALILPGVHVAAMPGGAHWAVAFIGDDDELYVSDRGAEAVAVLDEAAIEHDLGTITGLELIAGAQGYTVMMLGRGADEAIGGLLVDLAVVEGRFAVEHTMSFSAPTRPILVRDPVAGEVDQQIVVWVTTRIIDGATLPFALRRTFAGGPVGEAAPLASATDGWTAWPLMAGVTLDDEPVIVGRAPFGVGNGRFEVRALFVGNAPQQISAALPAELRGEPASIVIGARDDADRIAIAIKVGEHLVLGAMRGAGNRSLVPWSSAPDAPALIPNALIYGAQGPVLLASRLAAQPLVEGVAVPIETLANMAPLRVNGPHGITPANAVGAGLTGALVGAERRVAWLDGAQQVRTAVLPCQ